MRYYYNKTHSGLVLSFFSSFLVGSAGSISFSFESHCLRFVCIHAHTNTQMFWIPLDLFESNGVFTSYIGLPDSRTNEKKKVHTAISLIWLKFHYIYWIEWKLWKRKRAKKADDSADIFNSIFSAVLDGGISGWWMFNMYNSIETFFRVRCLEAPVHCASLRQNSDVPKNISILSSFGIVCVFHVWWDDECEKVDRTLLWQMVNSNDFR